MSDAVWLGVITGVLSLLGTAVTAVVALLMHRLNIRAAEAAKEVKQVAVQAAAVERTLADSTRKQDAATTRHDDKLESIAKTGADVLIHVNSQRGVSLKLIMDLSRWKYDQTTDPAEKARAKEAADAAAAEYAEHQRQQTVVDSQKGMNSSVSGPGKASAAAVIDGRPAAVLQKIEEVKASVEAIPDEVAERIKAADPEGQP